MARFEDQPVMGKQDLGFRSDEVRGPYREEWAASGQGPAEDHVDSPAGTSGLGDAKNPAWAGAQASLESDVAGRGMYGAGEEGASGYGKHQSADGEMVASPTKYTAAKKSQTPSEVAASAPTETADEGYGTRHWGHGEFKGEEVSATEGDGRSRLERAARTVGRFFGIGPKGYRRSDERIHEDVCEALLHHHELDAADIEVTVTAGKVALKGTVKDRQQRRFVEEILEKIPGLGDIEDHLRTETYVARTEEADRLKTGEAEVSPTLHS